MICTTLESSHSQLSYSIQIAKNGSIIRTIWTSRVERVFQAQHAQRYEKEVMKGVRALKLKMEKETGVDIPLSRPPEGGTTATVAVIQNNFIHTGWVGDSKAVLGRYVNKAMTAVDLSTEHNVELNKKEVERAEGQGGTVCGKYITVNGAEGMIQLLRSLGDCGHHEHGKHCPRHRLLYHFAPD